MDQDLLDKIQEKAIRKNVKKTASMKVNGKKAFNLQRIIAKKKKKG